jgi:hypothetical protein
MHEALSLQLVNAGADAEARLEHVVLEGFDDEVVDADIEAFLLSSRLLFTDRRM